MMTVDPNEGWSFEGPDPEVGIFGDRVVHEDCPVDVEEAEVTDVATFRSTGDGYLEVTRVFTCTCGATTRTVDTYPAAEGE